MLCDRILGNVDTDAAGRYASRSRDALELTWRECARRAVRGRTEGGRTVGVLLPLGTHLRHGDVLADDGDVGLVVVTVVPCETWVADFADPASMAMASLELGNLHVPVEVIAPLRLVTIPDGPIRGVLDRLASSWRAEVRRFQPLRATVSGESLQLSERFSVVRARPQSQDAADPQLTNSRE